MSAPSRAFQEQPAAVDPGIVLAGGWLAMASSRLRATKGARLAMVLAAAQGCATLAALVWWFMYVGNRANVDASMLQTVSIGVLAAFALGTLANVRLVRGAPEGASRGGAAKAIVAVPLAVALLSLAMAPTVEKSIGEAREAWRRSLENPYGDYAPPRPPSKPVEADPTFPVPGR